MRLALAALLAMAAASPAFRRALADHLRAKGYLPAAIGEAD